MQIVETISDCRSVSPEVRQDRKIGLVPTMGALHEGHLSLVRAAKQKNDFVVVSIFVNPTQFGPNEDFSRYPRTFEADAATCEAEGVDLIFHPSREEMYPVSFGTFIDVEGITERLEGEFRPGHFRGVATIVLKLFTAVEPDRAYFGMKDYQQLKVIEKMVRDLNINVEIVPVPTLREHDGLAISSRNAYLSQDERRAALVLYRSLIAAKQLSDGGETDAETIRQQALRMIQAEPLVDKIDYVEVVDPETFDPISSITGGALVAVAVRMGKTRLIDNILIGRNTPEFRM